MELSVLTAVKVRSDISLPGIVASAAFYIVAVQDQAFVGE